MKRAECYTQATDGNMARAHCVLNTEGYKHSHYLQYLLLSHYNTVRTKPAQCYVIRTACLVCSFLSLATNEYDRALRCTAMIDGLRCSTVSVHSSGKKRQRLSSKRKRRTIRASSLSSRNSAWEICSVV